MAESSINEPKENGGSPGNVAKGRHPRTDRWRGYINTEGPTAGADVSEFHRGSGVTSNRYAGEFSRNSIFHRSRVYQEHKGGRIQRGWCFSESGLLWFRCWELCSCWACPRSCTLPGMLHRGRANQKTGGWAWRWILWCGLSAPAEWPCPWQTGPCHHGRISEAFSQLPFVTLWYFCSVKPSRKFCFPSVIQLELTCNPIPYGLLLLSLPEFLLRNFGSPGGSTTLSVWPPAV